MRRFSALFLCLVLCLTLFPRYAFAAANDEVPTVIWSGYLDDGYYGVLASAENRYDAAAVALGYNPALFSSEVRSKLSDVNYGGNFYKYATTFDEVSSAADYPEWVPAYVSIGNIISDYWHFGTGFPPWKSRATNTLYTNALIDLKLILSGEDLGGGGSFEGTFHMYSVDAFANSDSSGSRYYSCPNATFIDGNVVMGSGSTRVSAWMNSPYYYSSGKIYVSHNALVLANTYINQGYGVLFYFDPSGPEVGLVYGSGLAVERIHLTNGYVNGITGADKHVFILSTTTFFDSSDSLPFAVFRSDFTPSFTSIAGNYFPSYYTGVFSTPFDVTVPPDGVWPDPVTPVAPTAPVLPEPAEPVVETPVTPTVPAPVWPDITINIEPDPTPGTTPSGLDYTELLTRINDNLISIDSFARAINSNLNSLRSDLLAEFNGVIGSLRNIYNYLLTIDSVLETHCTHLRNKMEESAVFIANYMRTLIKWLADQLDFEDLTNVEAPDNSLLTTINEKLGGGTYEPNPIKDEQGYYQWLDDLWDRFLLGDNWQSSMGSISGSFNELKTRFPFSIPWDVVALFRLFVHDPVTPVFDLPLYFSSDGSTPVHVDLTSWDSVAAVVRPLVFVIFALKLALLSRNLLGGLGADKGGL